MSRTMQTTWLIAALSLTLAGPACGGDDEADVLPEGFDPNASAQPQQARQTGPAPGRPAAQAPGAPGAPPKGLTNYQRLEAVVPEAERETIRDKFSPRDYAPDITGNDNRDPFRSYGAFQNIGPAEPGTVSVATTEICTERNMVAPNPRSKDPRARKSYALRDLRLQGIVVRGTRGYAIFRDPSGYGHLVGKNDCVGKEKARVTDMGLHFVEVEVLPEPGPNQLNQEPVARKFELYREELPLDEDEIPEEEEE